MMVQYAKFTKMALETPWRGDVAALTYIETSTWTRQGAFVFGGGRFGVFSTDELAFAEHNGYSHQNPGFISTVLSLPTQLARVYFPYVLSSRRILLSLIPLRSFLQRRRQHLDFRYRSLPQVEELCQPHRRYQGSFARLPYH
jgi:hypothetical protein